MRYRRRHRPALELDGCGRLPVAAELGSAGWALRVWGSRRRWSERRGVGDRAHSRDRRASSWSRMSAARTTAACPSSTTRSRVRVRIAVERPSDPDDRVIAPLYVGVVGDQRLESCVLAEPGGRDRDAAPPALVRPGGDVSTHPVHLQEREDDLTQRRAVVEADDVLGFGDLAVRGVGAGGGDRRHGRLAAFDELVGGAVDGFHLARGVVDEQRDTSCGHRRTRPGSSRRRRRTAAAGCCRAASSHEPLHRGPPDGPGLPLDLGEDPGAGDVDPGVAA